jgi:hypothetical protein
MAQAARQDHQELAAASRRVERLCMAARRQLPDLRGQFVRRRLDQIDTARAGQTGKPGFTQGLVAIGGDLPLRTADHALELGRGHHGTLFEDRADGEVLDALRARDDGAVPAVGPRVMHHDRRDLVAAHGAAAAHHDLELVLAMPVRGQHLARGLFDQKHGGGEQRIVAGLHPFALVIAKAAGQLQESAAKLAVGSGSGDDHAVFSAKRWDQRGAVVNRFILALPGSSPGAFDWAFGTAGECRLHHTALLSPPWRCD